MRLCAAQTRFAVKEVDIGLAADIGTLSRLPRCVGNFGWVKDVCLSARDFSAAEALAVGFVSQVHDTKAAALDAGLKMAAFLAGKSPVAVQGTKEILNHARDHSVDESKLIPPSTPALFLLCLAVVRTGADCCYHHRSAVYCHMERGHVAVGRCLYGAVVGHPEEEADFREALGRVPLLYSTII